MILEDIQRIKNSVTYKQLCEVSTSTEGNLLEVTNTDTMVEQVDALTKVIREVKPKRVLETGTNKGMFGLLLYYIEPSAQLVTFGDDSNSQKAVDILSKFMSATFICGDTKISLPHFEGEFDFAWIDAGHDYPDAFNDIYNAMRLAVPFIAIDDANLPNVKQAVVDNLKAWSGMYTVETISNDERGILLLRMVAPVAKRITEPDTTVVPPATVHVPESIMPMPKAQRRKK